MSLLIPANQPIEGKLVSLLVGRTATRIKRGPDLREAIFGRAKRERRDASGEWLIHALGAETEIDAK